MRDLFNHHRQRRFQTNKPHPAHNYAKRTQSPYGHGMPCPYNAKRTQSGYPPRPATPYFCETNPIYRLAPPFLLSPLYFLLSRGQQPAPPNLVPPPHYLLSAICCFLRNEPNLSYRWRLAGFPNPQQTSDRAPCQVSHHFRGIV